MNPPLGIPSKILQATGEKHVIMHGQARRFGVGRNGLNICRSFSVSRSHKVLQRSFSRDSLLFVAQLGGTDFLYSNFIQQRA